MKRLLALVIVSLSCSIAPADPSLDLSDAMKLLGSDSPSDRDRGEQAIGVLADTQAEAVRMQLGAADPEVRVRIRRALREHHVLNEEEILAEAQSLLERFDRDPEEDPAGREGLVDDLLDLGAPALRLLQAEFENVDLEPVEPPTLLVIGGEGVPYSTYVKNRGRVGAWFAPARTRCSSIGWISEDERPGLEGPEETDHDLASFRRTQPAPASLRSWLLTAHRIAPGASGEWDSLDACIENDWGCRVFETRGGRDLSAVPAQEVIDGVSVKVRKSPLPRTPRARIVQLKEVDSHAFDASIVRENNRWGLRLTAREWPGPTRTSFERKRHWFVALDSQDKLLGFGPMSERATKGTGWAVGETRTAWLESPLPRGTAKLWMGFDYGDDQGEQAVAKPIEISPAQAEAAADSD